jgi:hypothetical protein
MATQDEQRLARHRASGRPMDSAVGLTSAIISITDNSGGTGTDTIAAIGATYNQAEVRNAVASLNDKLEEVLVLLKAVGIRD